MTTHRSTVQVGDLAGVLKVVEADAARGWGLAIEPTERGWQVTSIIPLPDDEVSPDAAEAQVQP